MKFTRLSSREFNQDVSRAKRAADKGPVVVTDRGRPAYVLMRHDAFQKLAGRGPNIVERLHYPGAESIDFDPPRNPDRTFRPIDLS